MPCAVERSLPVPLRPAGSASGSERGSAYSYAAAKTPPPVFTHSNPLAYAATSPGAGV